MPTQAEGTSNANTPERRSLEIIRRLYSMAIQGPRPMPSRQRFMPSRPSFRRRDRNLAPSSEPSNNDVIVLKPKSRVPPPPDYNSIIDLSPQIQALPHELQTEILQFTLLATLPTKEKLNAWDSSWSLMLSPDKQHSEIPCWEWDPTRICSEPFVTHIDAYFKFPAALQIDSKTRQAMSEVFYRDAAFYLNDFEEHKRNWMSVVPRDWLEEITVFAEGPQCYEAWDSD